MILKSPKFSDQKMTVNSRQNKTRLLLVHIDVTLIFPCLLTRANELS